MDARTQCGGNSQQRCSRCACAFRCAFSLHPAVQPVAEHSRVWHTCYERACAGKCLQLYRQQGARSLMLLQCFCLARCIGQVTIANILSVKLADGEFSSNRHNVTMVNFGYRGVSLHLARS